MCDLIESWKHADAKMKQRGAILVWCIWTERNKKVFEGNMTPNSVMVERVKRLVEEQGRYDSRIYKHLMPHPKSSYWIAPPGVIKINADAYFYDEGWVGIKVIARDYKGEVLFAASRRIRAWWPPEVAEAKALAVAIKLGKRYGV